MVQGLVPLRFKGLKLMAVFFSFFKSEVRDILLFYSYQIRFSKNLYLGFKSPIYRFYQCSFLGKIQKEIQAVSELYQAAWRTTTSTPYLKP